MMLQDIKKDTPPLLGIFLQCLNKVVSRLISNQKVFKGYAYNLRSGFFLKKNEKYTYNVYNTAATPLNNAQPWWLFYAWGLCKYTGGYHA